MKDGLHSCIISFSRYSVFMLASSNDIRVVLRSRRIPGKLITTVAVRALNKLRLRVSSDAVERHVM